MVAFSAFTYVMLDGLDLGVQLLVPSFPTPRPRCEMDNEVSVWTGNETCWCWVPVGLCATFPLAYAVLMPALYDPIIAMLLGLQTVSC